MGITVKELCQKFTEIKDYELKQLVGKSNFSDNDVIPLNNFAQCTKMKYKNFAAEREGKGFVNLLKGSQQIEVAKNAGITLAPANNYQNPFDFSNQRKVMPVYQSSSLFSQSLFMMKKAV